MDGAAKSDGAGLALEAPAGAGGESVDRGAADAVEGESAHRIAGEAAVHLDLERLADRAYGGDESRRGRETCRRPGSAREPRPAAEDDVVVGVRRDVVGDGEHDGMEKWSGLDERGLRAFHEALVPAPHLLRVGALSAQDVVDVEIELPVCVAYDVHIAQYVVCGCCAETWEGGRSAMSV